MEYYTPDLLRAAVNVTHALDDRFGLPRKAVYSQRDVPGLTRGALPHLVDLGVRMISIGVNSATSPPSLPRGRPFIWRDRESGAEILMMLHPGGGRRVGQVRGGWEEEEDYHFKLSTIAVMLGLRSSCRWLWREC